MGFYSVKVQQSSVTKFLMQVYTIKELCQRKLWLRFWSETLIVQTGLLDINLKCQCCVVTTQRNRPHYCVILQSNRQYNPNLQRASQNEGKITKPFYFSLLTHSLVYLLLYKCRSMYGWWVFFCPLSNKKIILDLYGSLLFINGLIKVNKHTIDSDNIILWYFMTSKV